MPSPEYSTTTVLGPAVKFPISTTAVPLITSAVKFLPSTLTVTTPVAFSPTVTTTVPFSPAIISPTVMLIEESYLGAVILALVEVAL